MAWYKIMLSDIKEFEGKVKINIQHNYRRERVFDKSG